MISKERKIEVENILIIKQLKIKTNSYIYVRWTVVRRVRESGSIINIYKDNGTFRPYKVWASESKSVKYYLPTYRHEKNVYKVKKGIFCCCVERKKNIKKKTTSDNNKAIVVSNLIWIKPKGSNSKEKFKKENTEI